MSSSDSDESAAKAAGKKVTQNEGNSAPTWLVATAKAGYGARGLIYLIVGSLAFLQAIGSGGKSTDSKGAVEEMLQAPGGIVIIWLMVAGLIGYSVWRLVQSLLDADDHGLDTKGLVIRGGLFVSAVTHIILAYSAARIGLDLSSSGGGSEGIVAVILGWPGGRWIVGLIGLCIGGAGVAHILKAFKEQYKKHFAVDDTVMATINPICKAGLGSRGIAFLIISGMFVYAAIIHDADQAGGLKKVFSTVSEQPYGPYLLGILAIGLFAFGIYSGLESLYRKIDHKS